MDGVLKSGDRGALEEHLAGCSGCQKRQREYSRILEALKPKEELESRPFFWERLQVKLKEERKAEPWLVFQRWCLRSVPLALALALIFVAALVFLSPRDQAELSQSEALLLRNVNPLAETRALFEEGKQENQNLMIIFAAGEEAKKNGR